MKKGHWLQPILWTAFWGALASCALPAQAKLVDEVTLVVDQEAMTRGELEESIQAFFMAQRMSPAKPGTPFYEKAKQFVVESFIREVLMAEEADRVGISVSDAEVDKETDREVDGMKKGFPSEADFQEGLKHEGITLEDLRSDIRSRLKRRIKANRAMRQQTQSLPGGVAVTDEEAREHFAKAPQDYEQVKFAVILFRIPAGSKPEYVQEVDKQAQGVLAEIKGGADFSAYARKYSEEKGSSDRGGVMGTFYRSELDPKLAKGIFAIPEKGMGIVRAPEGFYIVRVDKKQKADYALVAKDIKDSLQKGGQEAGLQRWFEGLKKNAFITLDGKPYQGSAPSGALKSGEGTGMVQAKPGKDGKPSPTGSVDDRGAAPKGELYPTLPAGGSLIFGGGVEGFAFDTRSLVDYHNPGADTQQELPYGFGLQVGMDYALDPTFQVGLQVEFLRRFTATVPDGLDRASWDASALAPSLSSKLLIPLDETTNFIVGFSGGYHFLMAGSLTVETPSGTDKVDLSAEGFGGKAGAGIEFFLDEDMNSSIGFGVDYRFLPFRSLQTKVVQDDGTGTYSSPLVNLTGGKEALVDFSGVNVGFQVRFYPGKD